MVKFTHSVIYITIAALPFVIDYYLKIKYKKLMDALKNREVEDYYHQSVFLNMNNFKCKQHLIDRVICNYYCSAAHLKSLVNFISSAKDSICICMYAFTLQELHSAVIKAHKKGVSVRIITDSGMLRTAISEASFNNLRDKGIPYKVQPSEGALMHHKFCLIDKDYAANAKMFFGSTNLTGQGLVSNFDSFVITNNRNILNRFSEEFEEMWITFS